MKPSSTDRVGVAIRLHSVAIRLLRRLRPEDTGLGLSAARLSALSVVVFGGPLSPGELAAAEQVAPPTMTRLLKALESLDLVERIPHPEDRRSVLVRATDDGRRLLEEGRARRVRRLVEALDSLDEADWELLDRALTRLEKGLAEDAG